VIARVLMAVDDSHESLQAARRAAPLAAGWGAAVRVLTVVGDHGVEQAIEDVTGPGTGARRHREAEQLLAHVVRQVQMAGVRADAVTSVVRAGPPARRIVEEARAWPADLVVMAVSDRRGVRSPYVGSETEHVLEFAPCPVLVVPSPPVADRQA